MDGVRREPHQPAALDYGADRVVSIRIDFRSFVRKLERERNLLAFGRDSPLGDEGRNPVLDGHVGERHVHHRIRGERDALAVGDSAAENPAVAGGARALPASVE